MKKVVIVGGVAGGASTAARLRRLKEDLEIIVLERGPYVSFANCGLPYYIGHVIKDQSLLELMTPEDFWDRFKIDVRINNEAISINRDKKTVSVKNLEKDNVVELEYDYLVLSPGASPIMPQFEGINDVPVFSLRTIPDSVKIKQFIENKDVKHATIIGGGFIGLEMAENLKHKGIKVKIVEMLDQVMAPLDKEIAQFVHQELLLNGVCLQLEDPVDSFKCDNNNCFHVIPKSGKSIETDMIIMAIGVKPENRLAKDAGLEIGPRGHIVVDEQMKTSDASIFAVGDAVQVKSLITNQPIAIPLAGPANKQGRIVADVIAGRDSKYNGILGASVVKVFDLTVSLVGLSEKQLSQLDFNYDKIYIHPNNHAGYYPGATPITLKLLFEVPSGKILGAQAVTEKRIDVISTVIKFKGTVFDLEELELTYAPPFGSAKDPVNMAGFVASNVLRGDMPIWHWHEIEKIRANNSFFLDVRTLEEYQIGTIKGATNISDLELRKRLEEVPKDKNIYVICEVGFRGYLSTRLLIQKGYHAKNLSGGYKLYKTAIATTEEIAAECGASEEIIEEMIERKSTVSIKSLEKLPEDKKLRIYSTDPGFKASVEAYAELNEAVTLLYLGKEQGKLVATLEKSQVSPEEIEAPVKIEEKTRKELRGLDAPALSNMSVNELFKRLDSDNSPKILIDVRTPQEYNGRTGHIKSAKLMPLGDLMQNISALEEYKDDEIVVICHSGSRSMMAAQLLARGGFKDVRNLTGGMMVWHRNGYPVIPQKEDYKTYN